MPRDFYPRRESEIATFTGNFSALISAAPGSFGLTAQQADEYAAVQHAFADLRQKSTQGSTNTSSVFEAKKHARRALEKATRQLTWIIRGQSSVTAAQRINLGLPVRDPGRPPGSRNIDGRLQMQRIGPPRVKVIGVRGRTLRVRLRDESAPMKRGRPAGVIGATLFSYVGEQPPATDDLGNWTFERSTSRTVTTVHLWKTHGLLPPGTRVWIIAFWQDRRGQRGPICQPVYTHTQYGVEVDTTQPRRAA